MSIARLLTYLGETKLNPPAAKPLIGVLEGTGIGSEVIGATLQVLDAVEQVTGIHFEIRRGSLIGEDALTHFGQWLPEEVVDFCTDVFRAGGAVLSGPGGGRYVYDLRRRFEPHDDGVDFLDRHGKADRLFAVFRRREQPVAHDLHADDPMPLGVHGLDLLDNRLDRIGGRRDIPAAAGAVHVFALWIDPDQMHLMEIAIRRGRQGRQVVAG